MAKLDALKKNRVELIWKLLLDNNAIKGVGMKWPKKIFFEFIVGLDRVAQDKLFGVGMTLLRPRVCPLETV